MAKQTFTTGQVLTAAQMTSLQQTAMGGGSTTAKTTSYVLVAADAGTVVQMNAAGATTITVNTALFAAGDTVQIQNVGAGVCTITAGTATVNTSATLALKQYDAGTLYFNSTSAAIFFAVDAADSTSPLTTKGDLYTFSTLDARLPVGTNGQTLVADSTASTGLKWATAASGSMTSIASGSLPTGSGTLSLTSISGSYTHLQLVVYAWAGSGNNALALRLNGDSGSNYGFSFSGYSGGLYRGNGYITQTSIGLTNSDSAVSGNNKNVSVITIPFYTNATTGKVVNAISGFLDSGSVRGFSNVGGYYYGANAAVTQIDYFYGSNFSGGTYVLYGVN